MIGREGPGPERPGPDYPPEWDTEPDVLEQHGDLAGAIIRTAHIVPPSADEVRVAVGDPWSEPTSDVTPTPDGDRP